MSYDVTLANRIREHLLKYPQLKVEEKNMFGGLAFMINSKMCINVSGENLMCRFDPEITGEVSEKPGFEPMIMRGKIVQGYCYVDPVGFQSKKDFEYWVNYV